MNNRIANDLIRYAELVEDSALISPEEMNCASLMRLAAEALAQPEQEPCEMEGWKLVPIKPTLEMVDALADTDPERDSVWDAVLAVAPSAPQRTWVGLTEEEIEDCFHYVDEAGIGLFDFAEALEAKLKEKNT